MSLWKKISLGVVIVILLLLGSVAFLVGTTSGLHLVFKAADRWVPGLDIGKVTGGWRDLTLSDVRYEQPGVAVKAGNLHLAVGLECLWNSSVCINDLALKDIQVNIDSKKMPPSEQVEEEEDSGPLDLSTPYPITLTRVALDNVNIKIDDTTVSVMDFTSGLNWQEKTLTLKPTSLKGLLIALPKVAEVAQEEVVEPKIENPQPDEKPLGETLKDLFSRPVLPEMTDVHLPLNLNIEEFKGEQLRVTGDTDITVSTMLLKVSSIDGNTKLDALDIDSSQGIVNASGTAQLSDNWPVDITLNSTLNVEPLKGEKVKLKVGGALREQLMLRFVFSVPGMPCIYYGDEAGVEGCADPFCRRTYPWGREDQDMLARYKAMAAMRNGHPVLKTGECAYIAPCSAVLGVIRKNENGKDAFGKKAENACAVTLINRSAREVVVYLTSADVSGAQTLVSDDGQIFTARSGAFSVKIKGLQGMTMFAM